MLALLSLLLVASASASALNESEPNNEIFTANGPIGAGETINGSLFTGNEEDWYWLQLRGQQQITMSATVQNNHTYNCLDGTHFELLKADADKAVVVDPDFPDADYDYDLEEEIGSSIPATGEVRWTTPPQEATYYVRVTNEYQGTCDYSFSVGPGSAYGNPPAKSPVSEVPEPNDLEREAYGPLKAGTAYSGRIDTINDVEWLSFTQRAGRRLTVSLATGACGGAVKGEIFNWWNTDETYAPAGVEAGTNTLDSTTLRALPDKEDYLVELKGAVGCPWRFELSPRSSVLPGGNRLKHHHNHRHP